MKNIAIFVSGSGDSAERIVKLFNEGNRLRTVLVYLDDSAVGLETRIKHHDPEVEVVHYPDEEWTLKAPDLARILRGKEVSLLVLDEFALAIPDEIMEATGGEFIRVSTPEVAPREVVGALEADLRKPRETQEEIKEKGANDLPPTPEAEWADALKIQFTPPKVPTTPPDVPDMDEPEKPTEENIELNNPDAGNYNDGRIGPNYPQGVYPRYEPHKDFNGEEQPPMPSTWLIWSILVTIFCCFIPGIIAIIFSSQVSTKYFSGDIEGSRRASRTAEAWIIASFVLGVISATLYIPFMLIGN